MRRQFPCSFVGKSSRKPWTDYQRRIQLNYTLPKELGPDTRLLFLPGKDVRLKLLMYDAAGEAYEEDRHFEQLTFIEHCTGIIMLIDPFSIPAVRDSLNGNDLHSVSPSDASPDDVYARLVEFLEQHGIRRGTRQVKIPLAVVVTKCDAFGLDGVIGLTALRKAQEDEICRARKAPGNPVLSPCPSWFGIGYADGTWPTSLTTLNRNLLNAGTFPALHSGGCRLQRTMHRFFLSRLKRRSTGFWMRPALPNPLRHWPNRISVNSIKGNQYE